MNYICRYYSWGPFSQTFPCCTGTSLQIPCWTGGKNVTCFWGGGNCGTESAIYLKFSKGDGPRIYMQDEEVDVRDLVRSPVSVHLLVLCPASQSRVPSWYCPSLIGHKSLQPFHLYLCPRNCGPPFWNKPFCEGSTLMKNAVFSLRNPIALLKLL